MNLYTKSLSWSREIKQEIHQKRIGGILLTMVFKASALGCFR
jgi:hypothetical protein